jgi:hypothetical protein
MRAAVVFASAAVLAAAAVPPIPPRAFAATTTDPAAEAPTPGWPHTITGRDGSVTVYPPQVIDWPDRTRLDARMAVAVQPTGNPTPIIGTLEISGQTTTDQASRTVSITGLKLTASHFPSLDTGQASALAAKIQAAIETMPPKTVPLDMVLMSLDKAQVDAKPVAVRNDPPAIFYSATPASLVVFDGEPVMAPLQGTSQGTSLSRAVNTNWPVFLSADTKTWFLLNNGAWFAASAATGPWAPAKSLPEAFRKLAADPEYPELHGNVPGHAPKPVPTILVSTSPAEIIVTDGPPEWAPVSGTSLQVATNTEAVLFKDQSGALYYLVSGRWFSAPGLDGPWHFASNSLPPDFAMISSTTPQGAVLASVPGTEQAQEAVIQAQIPTQATLSRKTATIAVSYAGPPQFKPIEGTQVAAAANTNYPVFLVGGVYYACWQGAWFTAPAPNGPWVLAASVPPAIYTIPPTSPYYPVTYVNVYAATPAAVTYGYTAGYAMGFITAGLLVYGTGYYYPPYVVAGAVPAYFPYPYSYAGGVYYNSATGAWGRGGGVYGPYYGAHGGAYYNPSTGGWARGGAVYGPNGGAGAWSAYNPATGRYSHGSASWGAYGGTANASFYNPTTGRSGSTTQNANAYGRWGSSVVSGPNQTVHTESGRNANGAAAGFSATSGAKGAAVHGAGGNNAAVGKSANGNVYAGADGNAYKKTSDGWSKWNNGSWNTVNTPKTQNAGTRPNGSRPASAEGTQAPSRQLDNDDRARTQGWQEQQRYSQQRMGGYQDNRFGSGGAERGVGYGGDRFGGGGFEGGGRFRR